MSNISSPECMTMSSGERPHSDTIHSKTTNGKTKPGVSKLRQPSQSKLVTPSSKTKTLSKQPKSSALTSVCNGSVAVSSPRPTRRSSGIKAPTSSKPAATKTTTSTRTPSEPRTAPTPKPPRRSAPSTEGRGKPKNKRPSVKSQNNSPAQSDAGPVAPPRSGAGIKRSVTARQSTSKSLAVAAPPPNKTKVCKHPSLEMERSISSESNISNESVKTRKPSVNRMSKMRQPSKVPERSTPQAKRMIKRPSSTRSRPSDLDLSKGNHVVKYSEKRMKNMSKSQSNSKESLGEKKVAKELSPRRSSMPSVVISPTELLLNQSLQNKLAANESNRHGFILTDTDASVLSGGSSEFLSCSREDISDNEILLTSEDFKLNIENRSSTISSSDLFTDIDDTDKEDDYDEVADCSRREQTPVRQDIDDVIRQDLATQISLAGALNDLSDPNRSPALNITQDEYAGNAEEVTTPQNALPLIPIQQLASHQDWNKKTNDKIYNSPDDNFQEVEPKSSDKDLYYDSSDLNLEASSSASSEDIDKELNTMEGSEISVEQKNNTVDQNMSTSFQEKALSTEEKDVEIKLSETPDPTPSKCDNNHLDPGVSRSEDVLSPLISETSDPLSLLAYHQAPLILYPDDGPMLGKDCDTSAVILPQQFPEDPIYFTRNQRSIRPSKRKSLLIRSSSLDKKYFTQKSSDLESNSLDSFDGDDMYIVEAITPCSPISISDREFLTPTTPEILITDDNMLECLDVSHQPAGVYNTPKRRFILRSKVRNDVTRRFSETQVFKHHKEKYLKRREMEEKYNSCPVQTSPDIKLDSPKYIRGFVKRVSSMLTPSSKPRVLMRKGRDYFGSTSSVYINFDSSDQARSLHDDGAEIPDRLNRSSSLEFDEHNMSSIRRTHSEKEKHETESSEYTGISTKAKSISEQLERIKSNLNKTAGIPPLDFTDWKELVPQSIVETLGKKEMEQQHHIWELITTEHNHITIISTVINSLLTCLKELHNENFLTKINVHDVFLNIERIREVHLAFWNDCIVPLIDTARDTGELLNPELLTESSILFEEDLNHPLFEYCIKYIESRSYIKSQQHKNNDFKEYINWCSNEIRVQHNKLGVDDILIKPIQRIQKYPILIRDILRKTSDDDTRSVIASFLEKVKVFVEALNRRKEEKEEQQKIEGIKERIESYSVLPSVSNNTNDQINQILNKYNKFDLADKVPLLNTQRKFLHETSCKLDSKLDSKTQDVTLFLFSDHILVTRPNKGSKKKNRIIKQPMTLDRVEIEELHYASHTNVVVYLNEYGSLVDMFLLQSHSQESHTTLLNAVIQAKDNYKREKNKLYTEMDATKSVSTCSMNSAGNQQAESPAIARHVTCSVTRSHSELGPTRRNMVDPASSVSRAQSMPASNDKRNHLPQSQSISSASSSSSSSSCSVSEGCNSEGSSRLATLSHIKESDKSLDSGEESTVIPNSDTLTGGTDPDTLKNYGPDVYIDNLSTEFKGKLDINKNICDTVNLQAPDEKLFTKSDAIFIDHSNAQSES
ncbi:hypothetical protein ACHWQZ_G015019 [Mnemiopsis leidyi]